MSLANLKKTFFVVSFLLPIAYGLAIPHKSLNIYSLGFGMVCTFNGFMAGFVAGGKCECNIQDEE